jgi:hypothetical protein
MTTSVSGSRRIGIRRGAIIPAVSIAARILCGAIFLLAGTSGIVFVLAHIAPPPAPTSLAQQFQDVFFRSHWVVAADAVQLICGLLLLFNRFTPLALVMLGAVLFNILCFHLTMAGATAAPALVALVLWFLAALPYRSFLAPLFVARPAIRA